MGRGARAMRVRTARTGTRAERSEGTTVSETEDLVGLAVRADRLSRALAWATDRASAALLGLLVLDVWLGVFARYVVPLPITFMEEAARYLMIWVALLALSSCIPRREHIGVQVIFEKLPAGGRRVLLALLDVLGIAFFAFLALYGLGLVERGTKTFTMIYGMSRALPFAAVPVGAGLAAIQLLLVAVRDQARLRRDPLHVAFP
jgi:TRAP-type C4-dicarboxylate transport system permease small subunit